MHLLHQHLARLAQAVEIGVVAVAIVGQAFHRVVLKVVRAHAQHAEEGAALGLLLDQLSEFARIAHAHVEIAVGAEDDAVDAVFDEVRRRLLVGHSDAARTIGAATGVQAVHHVQDARLVLAAGAFQGHAALTSVGDDGNMVIVPKLLGEHLQALLHQRQPLR